MSKFKHILSAIHFTVCGLCVFSLPISLVKIERIYILCLIIIIKSEKWTIIHCLGLRLKTMVCAACLSIFLWIVTWPDCFVGHSCLGDICPQIWLPVTDMQHYYHTWYPTDDWQLAYMFSLVYFSVEVCLVGVFPHSVSTRRDPCVRVCAPLTLASPLTTKQNRRGCDPTLHLSQVRGIWTDAWVGLHYRVVIWVAR